ISGSREAFTAAALFVVAGVSLGVAQVGLSMALGAFLAGVLLAESSFRHQIESDIEPFRELLLGLFFIGVGMQLDLSVVFSSWWIVLCGAAGLIILKGVILYILSRLFKAEHNNALRVGGVLSQGGEFGFVVFSLGVGEGLFTNQMSTLLSAIITLSMMATPVIMIVLTNLIRERSTTGSVTHLEEADSNGSVIIAGFGRMGQVVNQILRNSGVDVTAVDNDPKRIEIAAQFDTKVYFGDVTNVNLLVQAGAMNVDAIVFTIDEREALKATIEGIRERCPNVKILARVHDRIHAIELLDVDADYLVREMFESSIALGKKTLSYLDFNDAVIEDIAEEFRERDRDRLLVQKAEGLYARKEDIHKPFEALRRNKEPAE
ncbi:MAG: cation:proton antiporter, partial [Pseudomonadota bacterium]